MMLMPDNYNSTDSFATYDGGSSAHASFGPGAGVRPNNVLVRKSVEKFNGESNANLFDQLS
mgnify:CR=1 FL=1